MLSSYGNSSPGNVNIRKVHPTTGIFVALGGLLLFHYISLLDYPVPSCDEAFYGRSALKFVDASVDGERWPATDMSFFLFHGRGYWLALSTAFSLLGTTLFAARMVSLIGLILLVVSTFFVGKLYVNRNVGLWSSGLVGAAWLSMHSGHLARPDMLAAAVGAASVAWAKYALDSRRWWYFLFLGVLLLVQIEIHPLPVHLWLPILLMVAGYSFRKKLWSPLGATLLGMLTAGAIVLLGRYGTETMVFLRGLIWTEDEILVEFIRGSSSAGGINWLDSASNFLRFWWESYAWLAPFVSIPQAVFFLTGLVIAYVSSSAALRALASLVLISSVTFALTNSSHSWLGYSLLWLPYYTVMGVAAVARVRANSPWHWLNRNVATVVLALHSLLYLVGDVYLVSGDRARIEESYFAEANKLLTGIPVGARVLAKQYWWYAMQNKITFLDEHLIAPQGSLAWWIGVPDSKDLLRPDVDRGMQVREQFHGTLRPDFVVLDGVLGCVDVRESNFDAFLEVVQSSCELKQQFNSSLYRPQQVYQCAS